MSVHATSPTGQSNASDSADTVGATPNREAASETPPKRASKRSKSARRAKRRSQGKEKYSRHVHEVSSVSEGDENFRQSTASETDEEAEVIGQIRMLQDPMKRLRMAVRSAYSLGLHRIRDTMMQFNDERARRNLWRSLFVLDRFLATALGRPAAICEEDCSSDALELPADLSLNPTQEEEQVRIVGLDSSVQISRSIGTILKRVYSERKISTKLAQDIVNDCQLWAFNGHPSLVADDLVSGKAPMETGIPILHVQLLHYHSILLLSRPFFIDLLVKTRPTISSDVEPFHRTFSRSEKFSQACVAASTHSVTLIQAAFEAKYLPRRNPFILYFLFAAALIILNSMRSAINIMDYCATVDIQARRMLFILKSFLADVEKHLKSSVTNEQSELALRDGYIGNPEEVLHTRRQSLTARRNQPQQQPPSTPVGGGSSSEAMEYYSHMETDSRHSIVHVQNMGPLPVRGERTMPSPISPTVPRRSAVGLSHYRRTDLALAKAERLGIEQEFEEFDHDSSTDFHTSMDSDETKVYTHDYGSTVMPHGEQPAFQVHHGGIYRTYSAPGVSSNGIQGPERVRFGGHYL
ncbi:fungal specific transcription factor domain-containing [Trichoderma arundinaceum]|uniref:Fungal specific transcription factor domain-containing n=1 Tax=Trichoderma arundinaceum TaxID=490622 RepID=A0A395NZ35_TRIAR|nr:fungal specific transcription factor domain-containing [Trichoderma arundinaceum]